MKVAKRPRTNTDVVMLQLSSGHFKYLSTPIASAGSETERLARLLPRAAQSDVYEHSGQCDRCVG